MIVIGKNSTGFQPLGLHLQDKCFRDGIKDQKISERHVIKLAHSWDWFNNHCCWVLIFVHGRLMGSKLLGVLLCPPLVSEWWGMGLNCFQLVSKSCEGQFLYMIFMQTLPSWPSWLPLTLVIPGSSCIHRPIWLHPACRFNLFRVGSQTKQGNCASRPVTWFEDRLKCATRWNVVFSAKYVRMFIGEVRAPDCAWLQVVGSLEFDAVLARNWKSLNYTEACFNINIYIYTYIYIHYILIYIILKNKSYIQNDTSIFVCNKYICM